jgi:hypothetical protein
MVGASRAAAARGQLYTAFARIERAPYILIAKIVEKIWFKSVLNQFISYICNINIISK